MKDSVIASERCLEGSLRALGVRFLMERGNEYDTSSTDPQLLIASLAGSQDARLRLALIPLFLQHPEFAVHAREAVSSLEPAAQITLRCYYTAARFLQEIHRARLERIAASQPFLPDLFSAELALGGNGSAEERLALLSSRHRKLTGVQADWEGTYRHAAEVWLKGMELSNINS